jgi:hypothetical protein
MRRGLPCSSAELSSSQLERYEFSNFESIQAIQQKEKEFI